VRDRQTKAIAQRNTQHARATDFHDLIDRLFDRTNEQSRERGRENVRLVEARKWCCFDQWTAAKSEQNKTKQKRKVFVTESEHAATHGQTRNSVHRP